MLPALQVYAPARTDSGKAEERVQYKLAFLEVRGGYHCTLNDVTCTYSSDRIADGHKS